MESIESLKGIGYDGYSLTVHRRKMKLPNLNTPGMASMRNNAGGGGENSGPIFLTHTPAKNFETAASFQKQTEQAGPKSISYYLGQRRI